MPRKRQPRAKPVPRKVTHRQQAFAREFLVDHNGTQAAIRAGYSKKGAHVEASKNLKNPKVQAELAKLAAPIKERAEFSAVELLNRVRAVAFGDIRELFKPSPGNTHGSTFKDMRELDAHQQLLVRNYEKRKDGTVHVTLENRLRAMELLMKHLGLLNDQMRLEVASGLTREEEEKIAAFSDQELLAWNEANDVIYYLLHPDETPGEVVPAGLLPASSQA